MLDILSQSLLVIYSATTAVHLFAFWWEHTLLLWIKRPMLILTCLLHFLEMGVISFANGTLPIHSVQELTSATSLMMLISYFILERFSSAEFRNSGGFVIFIATLLQFVSNHSVKGPVITQEISFFLDAHILIAILGYSSLFMSGIYCLLYLFLFYSIQQNRFGAFFEKLTNLETMQNMIIGHAFVGFCSLSVAFSFGMVALFQSPFVSLLDPKLVSFFFIWSVYGVCLFYIKCQHWQGETIAFIFGLCFSLTFIVLIAINFLSKQFHLSL